MSRFRCRLLLGPLALLIGMAGLVRGEGILLETAADRDPLSVERIVSLDDAGLRIEQSGKAGERSVPRDEILSLTFPVTGRPDAGEGFVLTLTSGDRLRVATVTVAEELVTAPLRAAPAVELTFPLEHLAGILSFGRDEPGWGRWPRAAGDGSEDTFLLKNADVIRGEFAGMSDDTATLATASGKTAIAIEDLRAVTLSPELLTVRPIPPRHAVVEFRDGSFLTVDTVRRAPGDADWLVAIGQATWPLPADAVGRIAFYSAAAPSLTAETPIERRTIPFLPNAADSSPRTAPETTSPEPKALAIVGGKPIPRGLAAGGRTEWTYRLSGEETQFRTGIDVPDEAGEEGTCRVRIEVDGKSFYESPLLRRGAALRVPPVPLGPGTRTLKLTVDYGEFWDVRNRGVWIDPRLIRVRRPPSP